MEMLTKIESLKEFFLEMEIPDVSYSRIRDNRDFESELEKLLVEGGISMFSVVNVQNACNSGIISVAYVENGTLFHLNFPWFEEC